MKKFAALSLIGLAFATNLTAMNGAKKPLIFSNPADAHHAATQSESNISPTVFFVIGYLSAPFLLPETAAHCNSFQEFRSLVNSPTFSKKTIAITLARFDETLEIKQDEDGLWSVSIDSTIFNMPENVVTMTIS